MATIIKALSRNSFQKVFSKGSVSNRTISGLTQQRSAVQLFSVNQNLRGLSTDSKKGLPGETQSPPPPQSAAAAKESETDAEPLFDDPRVAILEAALNTVEKFGWSDVALATGAKELGYPSLAHGMFMMGPIELVYHFMDKGTEHMQEQVKKAIEESKTEMDGFATAELAMVSRLEFISRFQDQWPDAMALGLKPNASTQTAKKLAELADEICFLAGDQSTDMQWYTKRAAVASVYVSSELFMVTDKSEGLTETRSFVKRRMMELRTLDKAPNHVADIGLGLTSVASAFGSALLSLSPVRPGSAPFASLDFLSAGLQTILNNIAAASPMPFSEPPSPNTEAGINEAKPGKVFEAAPEHDPLHHPGKTSTKMTSGSGPLTTLHGLP